MTVSRSLVCVSVCVHNKYTCGEVRNILAFIAHDMFYLLFELHLLLALCLFRGLLL